MFITYYLLNIINRMSLKNYVCVTCGQDFTRNYSAIRHNRLLHQQTGKIVHTLEYHNWSSKRSVFTSRSDIVQEKEEGTYRQRWPSNFPFVRVAHYSDGSQRGSKIIQKPKESIQEAHESPPKHIPRATRE